MVLDLSEILGKSTINWSNLATYDYPSLKEVLACVCWVGWVSRESVGWGEFDEDSDLASIWYAKLPDLDFSLLC